MKLVGFMRTLFALSLLLVTFNLSAAPVQFPEIVRIIGPDSKQVVGAVKKETGESIEVVELKTGQSITFAKASIKHTSPANSPTVRPPKSQAQPACSHGRFSRFCRRTRLSGK